MDDNIILAMSENLSEGNLPVYYKYRYTFKPKTELNEQIEFGKRILKYIKNQFALGDKITAGIEHYTKGMLQTKPHIHIHFMSRTKGDTIRKALTRQWPEEYIGRCQSCKAEVLVDESKFWRYPLKQQMNDSKVFGVVMGFDDSEKQIMVETAYACWKQSAEILIGKLEKKEEKSSRERLFSYLDLNRESLNTLAKVHIEAYKYFVENENILNVPTVDGYINIWLLKNQIISYTDFLKIHNPNFLDRNI